MIPTRIHIAMQTIDQEAASQMYLAGITTYRFSKDIELPFLLVSGMQIRLNGEHFKVHDSEYDADTKQLEVSMMPIIRDSVEAIWKEAELYGYFAYQIEKEVIK